MSDTSQTSGAGPVIDETHDVNLKSWVESANDPASEFPIQNLPLCVFVAQHDGHTHAHLGVVIGDRVLDVSLLGQSGLLNSVDPNIAQALHAPAWNMIARYPALWRPLRREIQRFLRADTHVGQQVRRLREKAVRPLSGTMFVSPVAIYNYTDFYASIHHATTVGKMFRPDNPLLPNYKWVPIGYHGRASSLVTSGTPIRRPRGQQSPPENEPGKGPTFGPSAMLDYELEVGCVVGPGNKLGEPVAIGEAGRQIFGLVLLNDWSARDVQKWEYQPLGPFLAKNFASTISPVIVTAEALAPFRCAAAARADGDPKPLPHLSDAGDAAWGGFDLTLEVHLQSADMATRGLSPMKVSSSRAFKELYWTFGQMIAHHTSNGCNLEPGDLIGSGTVSGEGADTRGCLLELTWAGPGQPRKPIELPTGEKRTFLQDGDTVIMKGFAEREGYRRIGFGECRGTIRPAE